VISRAAEGAHPRDIAKENTLELDTANEGRERVKENFQGLQIWRRNMLILY
jgi:hypothetical protein